MRNPTLEASSGSSSVSFFLNAIGTHKTLTAAIPLPLVHSSPSRPPPSPALKGDHRLVFSEKQQRRLLWVFCYLRQPPFFPTIWSASFRRPQLASGDRSCLSLALVGYYRWTHLRQPSLDFFRWTSDCQDLLPAIIFSLLVSPPPLQFFPGV